jgi:hypothetical protein
MGRFLKANRILDSLSLSLLPISLFSRLCPCTEWGVVGGVKQEEEEEEEECRASLSFERIESLCSLLTYIAVLPSLVSFLKEQNGEWLALLGEKKQNEP